MFKCIPVTDPSPFLAMTLDFIRQRGGNVITTFKMDLLQHQTDETDFPLSVATSETYSSTVEEVTLSYVRLETVEPCETTKAYYFLLLNGILQMRSGTIDNAFNAYVAELSCLYTICPTPGCPIYDRYRKLLELLSSPVPKEKNIQFLYNGVTTRPYLIKNTAIVGNLLILDQYSIIPLIYIGGFMMV